MPGEMGLLISFMDTLDKLAKADIYIARVCANAFTSAGEKLCEELEMTRLAPHVMHGTIYEKSMTNIIIGLLKRGPNLLRNYRSLSRKYGRASGTHISR